MAVNIYNTTDDTLLSGTSGKDTISNGETSVNEDSYEVETVVGGSNVTIDADAGNDTVFNNGNYVSISGGHGDDAISNGELFMGDLKSEGGSNVTINGGAGNDFVFNNGNYVSISGGDGNDNIYNGYDVPTIDEYACFDNGGEYVTISGGAGTDYIYNDKSNVSIFGDFGDDTIKSYFGSNMTINGGKGNDYLNLHYFFYDNDGEDVEDYEPKHFRAENVVIQYASGDGDDTIVGFSSTDTLQITEGNYTTVNSGNDLIVKVGSASITLKDVSTANIDGELALPTGLSYNSDKTKITASKKFTGSTINLTKYPKIKSLDASAVTKKLKITGNSLDNTIEGGKKTDTIYGGAGDDKIFGNGGNDKLYGGKGNDTLYGGSGDDTLTGGDGNDVFVHTKGKDVITDYKVGEDIIKLQDATIKSWKVSGKNVVFTTTGGKITVKNGKGKAISILETKTYSSSSALFAEDNFVTTDNLSEIVAEKSVGEVEFTKPENPSQENLITFSAK